MVPSRAYEEMGVSNPTVPYTATNVPVYLRLSIGRVRQHWRLTVKCKLYGSTRGSSGMARGIPLIHLVVPGELTAIISVAIDIEGGHVRT